MEMKRPATRTWLIVIAVLIVAGVAAYFIGGALERRAGAKAVAAAELKYEQSQADLARAQAANSLLQANIWIYRATTAMDNRNFGLANDAMVSATDLLAKVDAGAAKVDAGALAAVQRDAEALKIAVATNLAPQRNQLIKLAEDVTALTASTLSAGPISGSAP